MNEQQNFSEAKGLKTLTLLVKETCYNYSIDFEEGRVSVLFKDASVDVKKGIMTWEIFFKAIIKARKSCKFFPTYADIMIHVNNLKESARYEIPESHQLEEKNPVSKEDAKKFFEELRKRGMMK